MKKSLIAALSALALLTACSKGDDTGGAPLPSVIGKWQLDNFTLRYMKAGRPDSNVIVTRSTMSECALDDYYEYREDGTGTQYYGRLCAGETQTQVPFQWTLQDFVLEQQFSDGRLEGMTISNISADYYTAFDTLLPSPGQPDTATVLQQYRRIQ